MTTKKKISITLVLLVLALLLALGQAQSRPPLGVTNLDSLHLLWAGGTATPVLRVDNGAGTNKVVEFLDGGTPVWSLNDGGSVSHTGDESRTGAFAVSAPTAIATATPALMVDSLGVSNLFEVRDAATPVFTVNDGGAWITIGAGTHSSGQTINNWAIVSAPTAIATSTPAAVIDSAGVSELLAVRDGGTDAFNIYNGGGVVVSAPTAIATAQPAFVADSLGVSAVLEVRDAATPIAQFRNGGTLDLIANPIEQDLGTENLGVLPSVCTVSITYTAAAGGSGTVCTIGAGEVWFVHYVYANVTTNFDATGDDALVDIGDGSDVDGLLDLDDAELQAADTEGTGAPAGWQGFMSTDTRGAYMANGHGFIYDGSETIDYAIDETSGETITAGALTIYVVYTRIQ